MRLSRGLQLSTGLRKSVPMPKLPSPDYFDRRDDLPFDQIASTDLVSGDVFHNAE
jgi:hypothetical protein